MSSPRRLEQILVVLQEAGVDFAIVGGSAAVAPGASTPTADLDIVVPREKLCPHADGLRRVQGQSRSGTTGSRAGALPPNGLPRSNCAIL